MKMIIRTFLLLAIWIIFNLQAGILVFGENMDLNVRDVLLMYQNSLEWVKSVSMTVDIVVKPEGYPGKGPFGSKFVFRRDDDRIEWIGSMFGFDSKGTKDPDTESVFINVVTKDHYYGSGGPPNMPRAGAMISINPEKYKNGIYEEAELGGPIWARTYGTNHKSIVDLLGESSDLRLRQEQENVNGISCYVLEGTTRYGKVTAWIAPEKGYAALKWTIEKAGDDLINDKPMSQTQLTSWSTVFNCTELEQIGDSLLPKQATFDFATTSKDGSHDLIHVVYTVSNIQLSPDFNTLGAFRIDLPDGTRVNVKEYPGVRYVWQNGKIVPDKEADNNEKCGRRRDSEDD
jgi:hypothetical protein